jgi:hypothetical protein
MIYRSLFSDYNKTLWATISLAFVYCLILSFQGFDLCDEGFSLTAYQQIFNCPRSIELQFVYYFGILLGGIWNVLFGFGGILSFRILGVITIALTIYFTALSLRDFVKPVVIPIATFLVLFMNNFGMMVFFHNYLTALLVSISVYYLLKGLNSKNFTALFLGAFFCGVNIFSRTPNITMLALGLLLIVDYGYEKDIKVLFKNILYCVLGLISGIGIVLIIMLTLGHFGIFMDNVFDVIIDVGTKSNSTHNFRTLLNTYIGNYEQIFRSLCIFVFAVMFFAFAYDFHKTKWTKLLLLFFYSFIIIAFSLFAFNNEKYYALILFPLVISCYQDRKNKSIIFLNVAALITMFFLPFGSDNGVLNMGYFSVWIASFVSVFHVCRFVDYNRKKQTYSYQVFLTLFYALFIFYGLYVTSRNAYNDRGSRWEKLYKANNPKFTVYASQSKTNVIDDLLTELNKYVKKDDYLICFESLPMIHYLTETRPYLGTSWLWGMGPDKFREQLEIAKSATLLPVVLKQKCQPIGGYWTVPARTDDVSDAAKRTYAYFYDQSFIDYFEKFLTENNYQVVWENELFEIYVVSR